METLGFLLGSPPLQDCLNEHCVRSSGWKNRFFKLEWIDPEGSRVDGTSIQLGARRGVFDLRVLRRWVGKEDEWKAKMGPTRAEDGDLEFPGSQPAPMTRPISPTSVFLESANFNLIGNSRVLKKAWRQRKNGNVCQQLLGIQRTPPTNSSSCSKLRFNQRKDSKFATVLQEVASFLPMALVCNFAAFEAKMDLDSLGGKNQNFHWSKKEGRILVRLD